MSIYYRYVATNGIDVSFALNSEFLAPVREGDFAAFIKENPETTLADLEPMHIIEECSPQTMTPEEIEYDLTILDSPLNGSCYGASREAIKATLRAADDDADDAADDDE